MSDTSVLSRFVKRPKEIILGFWEYYYVTYVHTTEHKVSIAIVTVSGVMLTIHPAFAVVGAASYVLPIIYFYSSNPDRPTLSNLDTRGSAEDGDRSNTAVVEHSIEDLKAAADEQRDHSLSLLRRTDSKRGNIINQKYDSNIYIERTETLGYFDEFREGKKGVFAVVGEAGMGKTNFLCALAEDLGQESPVLFYNGVNLRDGLKTAIEQDFADICESTNFDGILAEISSSLADPGEELYVFIDGLNEAINERGQLRSDLNDIAQTSKDSPWRVVLSCRTRDWEYWYRDETRMVLDIGREVFTPSDVDQKITRGVELDELSDKEFRQMWQTYKSEFDIEGELSELMRDVCREPFMMRLVAEVYSGGKEIPDYVEPLSLFEKYLDEKFPSERVRMNVQRLLFTLAEKILDKNTPSVSIADIDTDSETVERLLNENILIYRDSGKIYFHYDLFLEYVISQYLLSKVSLSAPSSEKRDFVLAQTERELRNIPGVVENILLSWSDDHEGLRKCLEALEELGPEWQSIVCSTIRKTKELPPSFDYIIERLAKSENYIIRTYISQSCSSFISSNGWNSFEQIADDDSWKARETVANIIGSEIELNQTTRKILDDLSDDYHWRVRRAVGYTLNRLWNEQSLESLEHKESFLDEASDCSWLKKHSISIGLLGTDLDDGTTHETNVIFEYARDSNPHVRWFVANYLPRYKGNRKCELAEILTEDPNPWVKRRLVASIPSFSDELDDFKYATFEQMLTDEDDSVRLSALRQAGKLADPDKFADTMIECYESGTKDRGEPSDIAVASAYTLIQNGLTEALEGVEEALDSSPNRRYREMIARRDLDFAESRFLSLESYISRRTEFVHRNDPYMEIIDTMCSMIDGASISVANDAGDMAEFFRLLLDDADEGVRWALVVYLARYDESELSQHKRFELLVELSQDSHHWVRREVAIALGDLNAKVGNKDERREVLKQMRIREREVDTSCSDEVLYFVNQSAEKIG